MRGDGRIEYACEHVVIHGCDGCCKDPTYPPRLVPRGFFHTQGVITVLSASWDVVRGEWEDHITNALDGGGIWGQLIPDPDDPDEMEGA